MHNCPLCHGHGETFAPGRYRCTNCGRPFAARDAPDYSMTADIADGFALPEQIDSEHPLTIGE